MIGSPQRVLHLKERLNLSLTKVRKSANPYFIRTFSRMTTSTRLESPRTVRMARSFSLWSTVYPHLMTFYPKFTQRTFSNLVKERATSNQHIHRTIRRLQSSSRAPQIMRPPEIRRGRTLSTFTHWLGIARVRTMPLKLATTLSRKTRHLSSRGDLSFSEGCLPSLKKCLCRTSAWWWCTVIIWVRIWWWTLGQAIKINCKRCRAPCISSSSRCRWWIRTQWVKFLFKLNKSNIYSPNNMRTRVWTALSINSSSSSLITE